jgi:hypothetical protein
MATAEFAVAMPAVALLLTVIISLGHLVVVQMQCDNAARVAARWQARGDDSAAGQRQSRQVAPSGAVIRAWVQGDLARGRVTCLVRLGWVVGPGIRVVGDATAVMEQP